jgi:hypothetical protein
MPTYEPIIEDGTQWTADLLPGSARWAGAPVGPLPEALRLWLMDLRLLRHLPFHYLVPRPELLPTESVRFFHVDPTFADRLVDGALVAGNVGTEDQALSKHVMAAVRQQVDDALAALAGRPPGTWGQVAVTGMLLRSTVVRRWPGLEVRAYDLAVGGAQLPVLRQERVADGILIVLFAGVPGRVEVQEPNEGTHFGVTLEASPPGSYSVRPRNDQDQLLAEVPVAMRGAVTLRLVDLDALATTLAQKLGLGGVESSRLAHTLQRAPYVQLFKGGSPADDVFLDTLTLTLKTAVDEEGP